MLDWLRALEIPHAVIATKGDRVKPSKRKDRAIEVAAKCQLDQEDVLWVSSEKGTNVEVLRSRLLDLLVSKKPA